MRFSEETRRRMSEAATRRHKVKPLSAEARRAISRTKMGKSTITEEGRCAISKAMIGNNNAAGQVISGERRRAISAQMKGNKHRVGCKLSDEHIQALRDANLGNKYCLGKPASDRQKRIASKVHKGNKHALGYRLTDDHKEALSRAHMGNTHALGNVLSEETRQLMSEAQKENWGRLTQEERDNRVRNAIMGCQRRPTNPEMLLKQALDDNFPNEWEYNGDGGQGVVVGGRVPDFIHNNGKKAVIEVFGRYWHIEDDVIPKIAHYEAFNFACLVVWDYECEDSESLVSKVGEWFASVN